MKNFRKKFLYFVFISLFLVFNLQIDCKIRSNHDYFDLDITSTRGLSWRKVQNKARDTVIQLFVQALSFNWLKPYQSPEEETFFGTGFFISNDGYIVSNFHVVDEALSVKIQIPSFGKDRFEVDVIGVCPDRDVALLKLTKESLDKIKKKLGSIPYLTFGDSDRVVRTQEILALGYPLGQEKLKSTQGIVSGRERVWGESYIQITAPLNKGNSGGPSLNSKGEVIGINTSGISEAQNIGYIIPIDNVKSAIEDLHKIKFLRTPLLGGEFNFGNKDMVNFLKSPVSSGLYFSRIYKDTLLEKAGIIAGDMLYEVNGKEIDFYGETVVSWSEDRVYILDLLNRYSIGQDIKLKVCRQDKKKEFNFKFDLSKQLPIRRFYTPYEKVDYEIIGGMVVMELTLNHISLLEEDNQYLIKYKKRENQYESKLIITHIFPDSPAQKTRVLWEGDILEEVNGKGVKNLKDFRDRVLESKKNGFLTVKNDQKQFMVLSLEKILEEEEKLADKHYFKISKLIEELGGVKKEKKEEEEETKKGIKLVLA